MAMPMRWSVLVLLLLFLLSLITFSRVTSSQYGRKSNSDSGLSSGLLLHQLQEEQHLRSRSAQIKQDLEENDLQLGLDCANPPPSPASALDSSSALTREERALQEADFEFELSLEIQHHLQKHQYDSTVLNESPSALYRHIERKLRHRRRLLSAYRASLQHQASISYASQECIAWRNKQQQQRGHSFPSFHIQSNEKSHNSGDSAAITAAAALSRFQQYHPNRRDLHPDSIFAQTLHALAQKQYKDSNGFVVDLDPVKLMAGSRRASTYQNDDVHVLVLDMQWDPEVTVVVGNVLDQTVKLRQEGYRPVMLNVGNSIVPGGDYHLDTATDNEADLFRRTTIHQCLDQEPRRSRFYPLSDSGGIYCPNQAVFRRGRDNDYEFMDRFEWISVVSVSPIPKMETKEKDGGLGGVQFLEGEDDLLRRRILAAMKVGVSQGHDALVLPPHGADAGQNPAEAIAAIYRSIIGRDFMGGRKRFQTYKKIVMVLDPEHADKIVNETSSYRPRQPPSATTPLPVPEDEDEEDPEEHPDQNAPRNNDDMKDNLPIKRHFAQDNDADQESLGFDNDAEEQEYENDQGLTEEALQDSEVNSDPSNGSEDTWKQSVGDKGPEEEGSEPNDDQGDEGATEIEFIDEEADDGDESLTDQLAPEDEVSESEALSEEQNLEEDADLSEEALEQDLSDVSEIFEAGSLSLAKTKEDDKDHPEIDLETVTDEDSNYKASSEEEVDANRDQQEEEEEEAEEEESLEPITETVRDVFERMLEQRSLLIVKNRARGLLGPEELDGGKAPSNTTSDTTNADTINPNPSLSASGVVAPNA
ncbi:hypothetical protein BX616_008340 [Lobosporangium transversale]|nr:hypothetical protein BX616_008340 [Lobosporangium transversale]